MYKHILIATDGSELATKGVTHGLKLAQKVGAAVTIVTVTEMWSATIMARATTSGVTNAVELYEQAARDEARAILDTATRLGDGLGLTIDTVHVPDSLPADGIIQVARDKGYDLIVMASHGRRGVERLILGSQTAEVVSHASVPVLVVR